MNYENLLSMCHQRRAHKLNEWSGADNKELENFIAWARKLPYASDFIFLDEKITDKEKMDKLISALGISLLSSETGEQKTSSELAEEINSKLLSIYS